jgi:very-short-patch-repair endonuclease
MQTQTIPNTTIRYFDENEVRWYRISDIGMFLDYKAGVHKLYMPNRNQITMREEITTTRMGAQSSLFVDRPSLKYLMAKTRKAKAPDLIKILGFEENIAAPNKEALTVGQLREMFPFMREQYQVDEYKVDGYFPDYNIVIECDENGHRAYGGDAEQSRTEKINKRLDNPEWIRFNPDMPGFSIVSIIQKITMAMHKRLMCCPESL